MGTPTRPPLAVSALAALGQRAQEIDDRPLIIIGPPSRLGMGLLAHLRRLPRYGDLLYTLTLHRIRVRYKQSLLGLAWAVLQPLALMLIFTVLFSVIFTRRMPSDGLPYAVFVYAAVLPWTFFSTAVANGTNSLVAHAYLLTKVAFPREILPLSYVTAALFDFLIACVLLAVLMLHYHVAPSWQMLYALPIVAVLALLAVAVTFLLSALQVAFRDVGLAVPLLLQIWMFASPVVYPLSAVPKRLRALYYLNPAVGPIEDFRRVTLGTERPDFQLLALSTAMGLALLAAGYLYFKYVDSTVADRV